MSLTYEEKEQLYEEFKERMRAEQEEKTHNHGAQSLRPALNYFDNEKTKFMNAGIWKPGLYLGWELIRKLTCRVCGVKIIKHISDEQRDLANEFAIKVTDLYFEYYKKGFEL